MSMPKSLSSRLMTSLLSWRNQQRLENLERHGTVSYKDPKYLGVLAITETGLAAIAATSVVETTTYALFKHSAALFCEFDRRPYHFYDKLLRSSSFTILWGAADLIFYNFSPISAATQEPVARLFAEEALLQSYKGVFFKQEDFAELANLQRSTVNKTLSTEQAVIKSGADFIQGHVLSDTKKETIEAFQAMEPSMYHFVAAKTVMEYVIGSKKENQLPIFLKYNTREAISKIREEIKTWERDTDEKTVSSIKAELQKTVCDLPEFEQMEVKNSDAKKILTKIKSIAFQEIQSNGQEGDFLGRFISKCWPKAIEGLQNEGTFL